MEPAKDLLDGVTPFNLTPMNYALQRALTAPAPYFATDATSRDKNRRWMLLLSDGAWNEGDDPRDSIPQLAAAKIKVYAAGFGTAGEVDPDTLQALSTGSGGQWAQVTADAGYDYNALAERFKAAVTAGLPASINFPHDPTNVLYAGNAEARHPIIITPYDAKVVFAIRWNTPDAKRMVLQLLTPTCDLLTPESVRNGVPGVTFSNNLRHQLYVIDTSYLRNDADPSQPRYGTWRMIVSSPTLAESKNSEDSERYAYDVLVESSLQMEVSLDRAVYYAGDPLGVSAKLTVKGLPITNAAVKIEVTMPGQAMANWLAAAPVTEAEYNQAAELLSGKEANPIYVKAYAARLKGILFDRLSRPTTIPMTDHDNRGVYTAVVSQTTTPDSYTLYVTATGITTDGVVFRRECTRHVVVGVRPDPDFSRIDVHYLQLGLAEVRVIPRDRFGNVLLVDPATAAGFGLTVQGAEFSGPLTSNLDSTYNRQMIFDPLRTPTLNLVFGGKVFKGQPLAPVGKLCWADRVLAFHLGVEAAKGANLHAAPNMVLGNIFQKPPDAFVSLGAAGVLVLTVNDRVILSAGDNDVTVFVQPDEDPRPYRVEAYVPPVQVPGIVRKPSRAGWVLLGESDGSTQSFSLRRARILAAVALRITDLSRRTRGKALRPLATPGLSIRGVGILKVSEAIPWGLDWLHRFYDNPEV